ncbi:MAG: hypothetical protein U5K69_13000 [Balneolaceae bacterium]|nr:hypothetical protein [Balneolaceae bacterium]
MEKIIKTIIKSVPLLVSLLRSKTPEQGKGIVKSGVASFTIAGLISTGKLSATGVDGNLLLILSILESLGYLYGMIAVSSGAAQSDTVDQLLKGNGEGLSNRQAKVLGREWLKQIRKNQDYKLPGNSLFDDDHSDLKIKAKDISQYATQNSKKNEQ